MWTAFPTKAGSANCSKAKTPTTSPPCFSLCLRTAHEHGAIQPFLSLGGRLPVAPDGIRFRRSHTIHCAQCGTRNVGRHKSLQSFHIMLRVLVVADRHNRVLPRMPHSVQPEHDSADQGPALSEEERKRDRERSAI
ncbi:MAG: hypothetical protein OXH99_19675 [Bryobacterales bacterium]|nr:hypothetical protein [Bryobacterales bacterium]